MQKALSTYLHCDAKTESSSCTKNSHSTGQQTLYQKDTTHKTGIFFKIVSQPFALAEQISCDDDCDDDYGLDDENGDEMKKLFSFI